MIIADKLTVLNENGDVENEDIIYNRNSKGLGYKQLKITGINNVMQAVDLVETEDGTLEVQPIENTGTNCIYIGVQIGVVSGSEIKFEILFLDEAFYLKLTNGMINVGTPEYELLYYSNLSGKDLRIADSQRELDYVWITYKDLFDTVNSLVKDEVTTFETLHTVRLTADSVLSYKFEDRKDLSNGKLEERRLELEQKEADKKAEREMRKLQRQNDLDKRKVDQYNRDQKYDASAGLEINSMFQKLLGK